MRNVKFTRRNQVRAQNYLIINYHSSYPFMQYLTYSSHLYFLLLYWILTSMWLTPHIHVSFIFGICPTIFFLSWWYKTSKQKQQQPQKSTKKYGLRGLSCMVNLLPDLHNRHFRLKSNFHFAVVHHGVIKSKIHLSAGPYGALVILMLQERE